MKRQKTTFTTAKEGEQYLKEQGHETYQTEVVETRTKKRAFEAVDTLLQPQAKKVTETSHEELERIRHDLAAIFRVFDKNRDGAIDESELQEIVKSLGKKATKTKIKKILKEAGKKNPGSITLNEFVDYMIAKKQLKEKKAQEMEEDEEEDGKEEEKEEEKKEDAPAKKKTKRGAAKKATPKKRAEKKKKVPKPAFVFPPSLSFVSSMSKERQEMFALSASIVRDRISAESADDIKIIDCLTKDDVVVVKGGADQIEDVLSAISIPFTSVQPDQLHNMKLNSNQTLFMNCHTAGYNASAPDVVSKFVSEGGQLISTDYVLNTLLGHSFPKLLKYSGGSTADSVVSMKMTDTCTDDLYIMRGFKNEDVWKLAGGAHPITVLDKRRVKVLLFSDELAAKHSGDGAILVYFEHEKGRVYHMISHFALQQTVDLDNKEKRKFDTANSYATAKGATADTVERIRTYEEAQPQVETRVVNYENVQAATTCSEFVMRALIQQHKCMKK